MSLLGLKVNPFTLKVILPIGISFYTFHGLSYVIDIYKNKIKPEKNFIDYAVFVSFFPLLVAGPIERATHLLPQLKRVREFNYSKAVDGLRQILWGLFKKIVIADSCAQFANMLFDHNSNYSGLTNALGAVFFAIQIYGDFSGYSDIALGTARLFGIELLKNFSFPYFSRDIAEFWRRWHISLSTWFRDYLYIPLGGSKGKTWTKVKNTFIIFLVSGFWHGANWTFIIWGLLNALYIMPSIIFNSNRNNLDIVAKGKYFPSIKDFFNICLTFSLTTFAWIFFRSENLTSAILYIKNMGNGLLLDGNYFQVISFIQNKVGYLLPIIIFLFIIVEWIGRESNYAIEHIGIKLPAPIVWTLYYIMAATTFYFSGTEQTFIYFQF
ncbi:MAG TPA: MBOAT family O-acyltransferase [Bacteroidia bacterium]|nr:MBOAT family O-acyltransferase [Bacteroidia bacterium]